MYSSRADTKTERVLAIAGDIRPRHVQRLRTELFAALDDGKSDVLLDTRKVTDFDDAVFTALVAGRSRAKSRRHRLIVVDDEAGVVARSLRRTGLIFNFPVYADADAAAAGLSTDASARAQLSAGFGPLPPPEDGPGRHVTPVSPDMNTDLDDVTDVTAVIDTHARPGLVRSELRASGTGSEAAHPDQQTWIRPPEDRFRRLRLRGGELDGFGWAGDIDVGNRVACSAPWTPESVYVVTAEVTEAPDGHIENITIPATF